MLLNSVPFYKEQDKERLQGTYQKRSIRKFKGKINHTLWIFWKRHNYNDSVPIQSEVHRKYLQTYDLTK